MVRRTCCNRSTGGVDVKAYGLLRVVGFEEEELGNDGGGNCFVHLAIQAYNAFLRIWLVIEVLFYKELGGGEYTFNKREKISSFIAIS